MANTDIAVALLAGDGYVVMVMHYVYCPYGILENWEIGRLNTRRPIPEDQY